MTEVTAQDVAALRRRTGAGVMDAKQALKDATGDADQAIALLKERGLAKAAKKGEREAGEGVIHSYIHGNRRIGVLLELRCETDFVARNKDFLELANDLALHIAASEGENPPAILAEEFVKDPKQKVEDVIKQQITALGENIQLARFTRYRLGDDGEG